VRKYIQKKQKHKMEAEEKMANEAKKVKDVFKDYEEKGKIIECEIVNVNIFKKSNKLSIELKSENKIQIGERLAFEFYLKSKFRVQDVETKINFEEVKKTKEKDKDAEGKEIKEEPITPVIIRK